MSELTVKSKFFQQEDVVVVNDEEVSELIIKDINPKPTKLYKHKIVLTNIVWGTAIIFIISTSATPNTKLSGAPAHLDKTKYDEVVSIYSDRQALFPQVLSINEYIRLCYLFYNNNSVSFGSINDGFVSDTVTEL